MISGKNSLDVVNEGNLGIISFSNMLPGPGEINEYQCLSLHHDKWDNPIEF